MSLPWKRAAKIYRRRAVTARQAEAHVRRAVSVAGLNIRLPVLLGDEEPKLTIDGLFAEPGDADVAHALLDWYDTTHGNEFGHDHHCPGSRAFADILTATPENCTCGWTEVVKAAERRDQLQTGAVV